ncbi:hypothetical protein H5410_037772 [Solanum commersonii]|uniref:Uncharacterized protein n=1 Tax=Solanum commersonii TaxID=4109 RepID=A0A9J5YB67_SOLCO|nr:hypothetical protein H5410_037772 [Solanum commersonii]
MALHSLPSEEFPLLISLLHHWKKANFRESAARPANWRCYLNGFVWRRHLHSHLGMLLFQHNLAIN